MGATRQLGSIVVFANIVKRFSSLTEDSKFPISSWKNDARAASSIRIIILKELAKASAGGRAGSPKTAATDPNHSGYHLSFLVQIKSCSAKQTA